MTITSNRIMDRVMNGLDAVAKLDIIADLKIIMLHRQDIVYAGLEISPITI